MLRILIKNRLKRTKGLIIPYHVKISMVLKSLILRTLYYLLTGSKMMILIYDEKIVHLNLKDDKF